MSDSFPEEKREKHIFEIDDLLKIIDYYCGEIKLSKKEIIKYDINRNNLVDYNDFLNIHTQIFNGKYKYRTEEKLYILKIHIKKLFNTASKKLLKINHRDLRALGRGIKVNSNLLKRSEYSDDTNKRGFQKNIFTAVNSLKKLGYNLDRFIEKLVPEK